MDALILIIGPAGRLREGLCAVLRTFAGIADLVTTDNFDSGYELAVRHQPSLVIVDVNDPLDGECIFLKRILSSNEQGRCLVIARAMDQAVQAKHAGADAILLHGFSTRTLNQTLVSLGVIHESGSSKNPTTSSRQQVTAFPLSQRN